MQHLTPEPLAIPKWLAKTKLGRVIRKATEKSLDKRCQSAEDMLFDLTGETVDESQPHPAVAGGENVPVTLPYLIRPTPEEDDEAQTTEERAVGAKDAGGTEPARMLEVSRLARGRKRIVVGALLAVAIVAAVAIALTSSGPDEPQGRDETNQNLSIDPTADLIGAKEEAPLGTGSTEPIVSGQPAEVVDSTAESLVLAMASVGTAIDDANGQLATATANLVQLVPEQSEEEDEEEEEDSDDEEPVDEDDDDRTESLAEAPEGDSDVTETVNPRDEIESITDGLLNISP